MILTAIKTSDPVESWVNMGFLVTETDYGKTIALNDIDILFDKGEGGLVALGWKDLPEQLTSISGIAVFRYDTKSSPHEQPNGVTSADHVVLHMAEKDKIVNEFSLLGISLRAERDDIYPNVTQLFFRPGNGTIIEVVVNERFKSSIWGVTFVNKNLNQAKEILGDFAGQPKKAIQKNREIMTIYNDRLGLKTHIAMMTPHIKVSKF